MKADPVGGINSVTAPPSLHDTPHRSGKEMKDCRCSFDEAVETFKGFIEKEGWSAQLLWLTRDRIVPAGRQYFIFRPLERIRPATGGSTLIDKKELLAKEH